MQHYETKSSHACLQRVLDGCLLQSTLPNEVRLRATRFFPPLNGINIQGLDDRTTPSAMQER